MSAIAGKGIHSDSSLFAHSQIHSLLWAPPGWPPISITNGSHRQETGRWGDRSEYFPSAPSLLGCSLNSGCNFFFWLQILSGGPSSVVQQVWGCWQLSAVASLWVPQHPFLVPLTLAPSLKSLFQIPSWKCSLIPAGSGSKHGKVEKAEVSAGQQLSVCS